jgi:hypothetical protein
MALPDLPDYAEEGYDWISRLSNGWYAVPGWGKDGWDLGNWPYVIVAFYDGNEKERLPYGIATCRG